MFSSLNSAESFCEIKINDCKSNAIKLYTPDKLFYCEKPVCDKSCQLLKNYDCIKGKNDTNDVLYNICQCKEGWKGQWCDEKEFYNTK